MRDVREERKKDRRRSWGQLFMRHKVFLNELSLGSEGHVKNEQIENIEMKKLMPSSSAAKVF